MGGLRGGHIMNIEQNIQLTEDIFALDLTGDFPHHQVIPGQFVNVLIGSGRSHPLRRPLSIAAHNPQVGRLTLVYRVVGQGTDWLSRQQAGGEIDVLGPLGRGFPLDVEGPVLVVGGGVGIPPLFQLVRELPVAKGSLDIILGFRSKTDAFWVEEFSEYGSVTVCTEDGSWGVQGFVTDALDFKQGWATLFACGPRPMLKALKQRFAGKNIAGFVSLEERMACGIGACLGCGCSTADGLGAKRVCTDGPVFAWEEVAL